MITKAEKTRKFIIEKAAPIFNQKGYVDTSLSTICESTGLSKGSVYGNFKDKNELAIEAFNFILRRSIFPLADQINSVKSAKVKLTILFDYYRKYYKKTLELGGCPILNVGMDTTHQNPELREKVVAVIGKLISSIQEIIDQGIANGDFKNEVDSLSVSKRIYSMIEGSIFTAMMRKDEKHIHEMMDYLDQMSKSEIYK